MNFRVYKKRAKRARDVLIRDYGYRDDWFALSDGKEDFTLDVAPKMFKRRAFESGFFSPMKGTPVVFQQSSYECDEWGASCAVECLNECVFWDQSEATNTRRFSEGEPTE